MPSITGLVKPEVVEFMEKLPADANEPADVVAAAADASNNEAGVEMEVPDDNDVKPELTIDEVKGDAPPA